METLTHDFKKTKKTVRADERGRLALGNGVKEKTYEVSENEIGQILLTPVVIIPEHEMWLYRNPEALELVRQGLEDARAGRVTKMSFAEYLDLEVED